MARKTAVVAGALGVIGRHLTAHLAALDDWDVIGLSRRAADFDSPAQHISVDLLDREDCAAKLAGLDGATHVFYAALQGALEADNVAPNIAMLVNLVDTLEPVAKGLELVSLMQGGKVYGCHLGPYKTPAKESDPRHMPPDFYYDQEDFLKARGAAGGWSYSLIRPDVVCGFAAGNAMNLSTVIAVYAAISKELGLPLRFPGSNAAYGKLFEVTDAALLARGTVWVANEPAAHNEAFNITNGDFFRWSDMWPRIADFFGMEVASPQPISLVDTMADKGPVWDAIVAKHELKPYAYEDIVQWGFGDFCFNLDYDLMQDMTKIRLAGFGEACDSEEMFTRMFAEFRHDQIIP
jgi:nucleoside-diphosphate-sugar epimerase